MSPRQRTGAGPDTPYDPPVDRARLWTDTATAPVTTDFVHPGLVA